MQPLFRMTCAPASRPAVVENGQTYSYSDLWSLVSDLTSVLAGWPLGTPIAVSYRNSFTLIALLLAIDRLGLGMVLLPTRISPDVLQVVDQKLRPAGYLVEQEDVSRIRSVVQIEREFSSRIAPGGVIFLARPVGEISAPESSEGMTFKVTSGSSGTPKIIRLGYDQLLAEARNISTTLQMTSRDRVLASVSLLHSYGFDLGFLAPMLSGCTIVFRNSNLLRLPALISESEATIVLGIPKIYKLLLERAQPTSLTATRYMLTCTGPIDACTMVRFYDRFGIFPCQHYGSSETGAITNHIPDLIHQHIDSVGRPISGVSIEIVDELMKPVREGWGFVLARSAAVASGYSEGSVRLNRPPHPGTFVPGGFWTSDIGAVDEKGFLCLSTRPYRIQAKEKMIQH